MTSHCHIPSEEETVSCVFDDCFWFRAVLSSPS